MAIAEVNIGGAVTQSSVKIIDIDKASNGDTTNSVVYKYSADSNKIITDIKYQEKGVLVCKYDDSIHIIQNDSDEVFKDFNSNMQFADIDLKGHVVLAEETGAGLLRAKTDIMLCNVGSNTEVTYSVDSVIRQLVCFEQIVAVNLGSEVHFVGLNGWLEKKYSSVQEVKDIVLGSSVAGIVYRDRIKIITF